jgi:hypothetical protein
VISSPMVITMLVIHFPFISLVKDAAKYTPGIGYFLDIYPWPKDLVGNFTMFSDLAFKVSFGLGSNFTTTSPMITCWS